MLMEVSDIADMLAQRIDALVHELLPAGQRDGQEWRIGSPAGEKGRSMAVHLGGRRQGVWSDFASGESGDALELVAVCRFGGNKKDAVAWAKSWLGIDNLDPQRLETVRRAAAAAADKRRKDGAEKDKKLLASARRLWHMAVPLTGSDPASRYLAGRGIDFRQLGKLPGALRFSDKVWCSEENKSLPAMLAAISDGDGRHISTHRTYLQGFPDLTVKKAALVEPKKTLGRFYGGFIALNRGQSMKPLRLAPDGDHVVICEGIEDGLTLAMALPDLRVLAGVSLSNYGNIKLPPAIKTVTIAADNDGAENEQAQKGLDRAVSRFLREGRTVRIARSPVGKDFNDYLQALRGGGAEEGAAGCQTM